MSAPGMILSGRGTSSIADRGARVIVSGDSAAPLSEANSLLGNYEGGGVSGHALPPRAKQHSSSYGRDARGKPKPRRLTKTLLRDVYIAAKGDPVKAAALIRALRDA